MQTDSFGFGPDFLLAPKCTVLALQPRLLPEGPVCLPSWGPVCSAPAPSGVGTPTRHCMDTPPPPPLPILHWQSGNSSFTSISPEWPDFEELETEWSRDAPDGRKPGLWVPLSLGGLCQVGWMPISQRMHTCSDSAQMTWSAWVTKRRTPPCASGDGEFTAL